MDKRKILLIEDDQTLSKVLHEELEDSGFQVEQAFNGEEGIGKVEKFKPNLILCDVLMPVKNGFETLEELKKNPATKDFPVIMLTMLGSDDDIKKGLKLGAVDYIVKSQHAVAEITDKVKEFFGGEDSPEAHKMDEESSE